MIQVNPAATNAVLYTQRNASEKVQFPIEFDHNNVHYNVSNVRLFNTFDLAQQNTVSAAPGEPIFIRVDYSASWPGDHTSFEVKLGDSTGSLNGFLRINGNNPFASGGLGSKYPVWENTLTLHAPTQRGTHPITVAGHTVGYLNVR